MERRKFPAADRNRLPDWWRTTDPPRGPETIHDGAHLMGVDMSLGNRLAVIEAAKAKADAERKAAEDAESRKRLQALNDRRRSLLLEQINRWKAEIVRAIEANEVPGTLAIEQMHIEYEFVPISDDRHPDNDLYGALEAWAHNNGMRITFTINSRYAGDIPVYAVTAQAHAQASLWKPAGDGCRAADGGADGFSSAPPG